VYLLAPVSEGPAPYTRGFGLTRFVSDDVVRSGPRVARGCDIIQLADALGLERAILGGFDWGNICSTIHRNVS
jgi:hypothetical protein